MFLTDYIKVYENAIPPDLCDELIKRFEANPEKVEGKLPDDVEDFRSYQEINVSKTDGMKDLQPVLMKIAELAVGKYQKDITGFIFPPELGCEQFRMKKYRNDPEMNDHYSYHVDVNSYASARRFLALIWYLDGVEGGGDTFFPHFNIRVRPQKGRLLMFPPTWMYPHSGEQPVSNDKYILGTYLHYL